jgi:uncharacterized protein (TIGR02118 family)
MHRLVVNYHQPADPGAFDAYYTETHAPLAAKIPGVRSFTTGHCASLDDSPPAYYMVAELVFGSVADMAAGMGSAEGAAAIADLPNFAGGGVTTLHYEDVNRL